MAWERAITLVLPTFIPLLQLSIQLYPEHTVMQHPKLFFWHPRPPSHHPYLSLECNCSPLNVRLVSLVTITREICYDTLFIHPFHVHKPIQHTLVCSTCRLPFHSSTFHVFIPHYGYVSLQSYFTCPSFPEGSQIL